MQCQIKLQFQFSDKVNYRSDSDIAVSSLQLSPSILFYTSTCSQPSKSPLFTINAQFPGPTPHSPSFSEHKLLSQEPVSLKISSVLYKSVLESYNGELPNALHQQFHVNFAFLLIIILILDLRQKQSFRCQIIVEMHMYRRDILLLRWNLQLLVQLCLVFNSIIGKGSVHVEDITFTLPGVAFGVGVDLFVTVKDLPNCFLFWNLKLIFSIAQSIDNANELTLLSQFADEILLIFPPRNGKWISLEFKMQIPPIWNVKLFLPLRIDKSSRLSCLLIKPTRYIPSSCLYQWLDFRFISIFLYKLSEIINIIEERHPNIIWGVVCLQFRKNIIPSFMIRFRDQFFKLICCTLFRHLINTQLLKNIKEVLPNSILRKTAT